MEKTKKLHRLHWQMIGIGLVIDVILWGSIIYVFLNHGSWWSSSRGFSDLSSTRNSLSVLCLAAYGVYLP